MKSPFYWGTLKGVGKVYVQVVIDVFCSLAFAKVYTAKMPVTAADLLYDRVLPFYEALGVKVGAILTDNGREFCGIQERHRYELLLAMEDIEHRTTKIRSPGTNGFVERMNRTCSTSASAFKADRLGTSSGASSYPVST
jgi:transposase InsO family protein